MAAEAAGEQRKEAAKQNKQRDVADYAKPEPRFALPSRAVVALAEQKAAEALGEFSDSNSKPSQINWNERPEPHQYQGNTIFHTNGPIKVRHSTNTMIGADGVRYGVKWYPLDKDGKRQSVIEKPNNQGIEVPSFANLFKPSDKVFHPPWDNPHGWEIELWIPPQENTHGNTGGHFLDVFLPKAR